MKAALCTAALTVIILTTARDTFAQDFRGPVAPSRSYFSPSCTPTRASLFESGYRDTLSSLIQAAGDYNYNTSRALINREEAKSRWLDNRKKYVQTYFEVRQINRQARAAARGPRPTQDDLVRYAQDRAPDRLAVHQVDSTRGAVHWPPVFNEPAFADSRDALDYLAGEHLTNSSTVALDYGQVKTHLAALQRQLRSRFDSLTPSDYLAAKKFLIGLDLEFRSPRPSSTLAAK